MKKHLITLTVLAGAMLLSADPVVQNVIAKQRYPWNGKVDITYEVVGDVTAGLPTWNRPILSVSATDHVTGTNYVAVGDALSGDTGTAEGMHHVVWDLNVQGLELKSGDMVFTVAYVERSDPKPYCIIDLSAGTNAVSYPITYMSTEPSGGFNTDEYKTLKLVLRLIEPGSFMMGGSKDVTLTKPYYIGVFEVTQNQYEQVMGENPSQYKGASRPVEKVSYDAIRGSSSGTNWPSASDVDSTSFMGKLRARTGLDFDLPTEAQWEYACRAGTTSDYNNGGSTTNDLNNLGRYQSNQSDGRGGYSANHTTVGMYSPNAWGLYDMHGNVWEWCLDWSGGALSGGIDPEGPSTGGSRRLRGGSWYVVAASCTSSSRTGSVPTLQHNHVGFRLVRTIEILTSEMTAGYSIVCSGNSASVAVDSRVGVEPLLDTVAWDTSWVGGDTNAIVAIMDNGTEVMRTTGAGEYELSGIGRHELTYTTFIGGLEQEEIYGAVVFKDWKYEVTNGCAVIIGTTHTAGVVVIPAEIDGYTVTGIANRVFAGCSNLTSVVIPDNVTSIGERAFEGCNGMTNAVIPGSVCDIGSRAFANCGGLRRVELKKSLLGLVESQNVFVGCPADLEIVYIEPMVMDVVARQRYPWNGLVDITCKVTGIDGATYGRKFDMVAVMSDSGNVYSVSNFWVVREGTNSHDREVRTNGDYHLLWNAQADLGQGIYSNMVLHVTIVRPKKVQLWCRGPYWADANIGAEEPWEYGYYFWWGDTVGYKRENDSWVASNGSSSGFSFYKTPNYGQSLSDMRGRWIRWDNVLVSEYDAAQVQWGGGWRMPTNQELDDLRSKCDWSWTMINGVNGYIISGRGDYVSASIFLPAAGRGYGTSYEGFGEYCFYWSSVPASEYTAWALENDTVGGYLYRFAGHSVRPVQDFTE